MTDILFVDMDGVCADFWGRVQFYCPEIDDIEEYEIKENKVNEICEYNNHIFYELEPIIGSRSAIKILRDYFDIYFLSTPMCNVSDSYSDKRRWLDKYYGKWAEKRLILTHRKDLNIGRYLIDDRLTNGSESFIGELIQFGTEEYPDWETIVKYLLKKR